MRFKKAIKTLTTTLDCKSIESRQCKQKLQEQGVRIVKDLDWKELESSTRGKCMVASL